LKELGLLESPENDTSTKKEKKLTPFKQKIKDLEDQFEHKTLGQYLYSLIEDENNPQTIRNLGTNRDMYRHEFDVLWTEQSKYHPELTDELKKTLKEIIFSQRSLKSQEDKVGFCKYFPEKRKISKSHPLAQEFIILGYLNNLTVFRDAQKRDTLNIAEIFGENL
jgi:CRISPR-associated endonuclease Csn1